MSKQITRDPNRWIEGTCQRCGKPLGKNPVSLELDQRINEYHDFGGVPSELSQGCFDFGADCAKILRKRARAAIAKAEGTHGRDS